MLMHSLSSNIVYLPFCIFGYELEAHHPVLSVILVSLNLRKHFRNLHLKWHLNVFTQFMYLREEMGAFNLQLQMHK